MFETFFRRFVLIASGTEIVWRVSLKFEPFFGNIAVPLSPVLVSGMEIDLVLMWVSKLTCFKRAVDINFVLCAPQK